MKKFFVCAGVFLFFFLLYWDRLRSDSFVSPIGLALTIFMGLCALWAYIGILNSTPRAWKELKFCYRRRQLRLKMKRSQPRQGTTTVVLN